MASACQDEFFARARHADIAEATLFLDGALVHRSGMGEDALLHSGEKDHGKLQPLGVVEGHQAERSALVIRIVEGRHEGGSFEECLDGRRGVGEFGRELGFARGTDQFVEVLGAGFRLVGSFGPQALGVTAFEKDHLDDVAESAFGQQRPQAADELVELQQALARGGSHVQRVRFVFEPVQHRGERTPDPARRGRELLLGGVADAARRDIDDASQAHVVVGVHQDTQVGENILYFLAVVKARAAHQHVAHAMTHEFFLEHAGLRVGAVEDRDLAGRASARLGVRDFARDPAGLGAIVREGAEANLFAGFVVGPEFLAMPPGILCDHGTGGFEDISLGAVVLLQADGVGIRVVAFEFQDGAHVGAAEAVDRLVVVAHHAEVPVTTRDMIDQEVLGMVHVLVFVDQNVAVASTEGIAHFAVLAEQLHHGRDQPAEVEGATALQEFFVALRCTDHRV